MASKILAIGECMAELAPSDAAGGYRLGFAGDTFNTAWYLARLAPDLSVSYFTAVGQDKLSQDLLAFMHDSRIDAAQVREIADRTIGLYLISLDNGERSFSYWRGQSAARHMTEDAQAMAKALPWLSFPPNPPPIRRTSHRTACIGTPSASATLC